MTATDLPLVPKQRRAEHMLSSFSLAPLSGRCLTAIWAGCGKRKEKVSFAIIAVILKLICPEVITEFLRFFFSTLKKIKK